METNSIDFSWTMESFKVFLPVVSAILSFMVFWFPWKSERLKQRYLDKYGDRGSERFVLMTKYLGGLSMGLLPLTTCLITFPDTSLTDYGFGLQRDTLSATVAYSVLLSALMIPIAMMSAKKPKNWPNYPQIRTKVWDWQLKIKNAWGWAVYLLGYEALFRGVLFFPLYETIGLWPAIAVNIALYAATHIPKGLEETIGAIPLAVVLCIITAATGNFWTAYIAHLAMAWANSFTALKYNPQMGSR